MSESITSESVSPSRATARRPVAASARTQSHAAASRQTGRSNRSNAYAAASAASVASEDDVLGFTLPSAAFAAANHEDEGGDSGYEESGGLQSQGEQATVASRSRTAASSPNFNNAAMATSRNNPFVRIANAASRDKVDMERQVMERDALREQELNARNGRRGRSDEAAEYILVFNSIAGSESLRLALIYSGVPFEEEVIEGTTYRGIPVAGAIVVHNNGIISRSAIAMLRYIGIHTNLYPATFAEKALTDEMIDELRAIQQDYFTNSKRGRSNKEKEEIAEKRMANTMMRYEKMLAQNTPLFGRTFTIADFELVATAKWLVAKKKAEYKLFKGAFPRIMALCKSVKNHPKVRKYANTRWQEKKLAKLRKMELGLTRVNLKKGKDDDW